jgi:hypothetical protein
MARTEVLSGLPNVRAYKPGQLLNASDGGSDPTGYLFTEKEWKEVGLHFTMWNHSESTPLPNYPVFVRGGEEIRKITDRVGLVQEEEKVTQFT